jgi:diaminopimelate epimerase
MGNKSFEPIAALRLNSALEERIMKYLKYHALGNDYIVLRPELFKAEMKPDIIRLICHRNYGIGSDGILFGPVASKSCDFGLRIFNPDGSEAEKSGNGLRIFARSLYDERFVKEQPFSVETVGGIVSCKVENGGGMVTVQMGKVSFESESIPVTGVSREVLNEEICVGGKNFSFCAATVGNPHCVVLTNEPSPLDAQRYGALIENDSRFPNRINVQFMKVIDQGNIQIEIWERGAGYTLASGSSSTAAAAVAYKLGLCGPNIIATMKGPVTKVCEGIMEKEMFVKK